MTTLPEESVLGLFKTEEETLAAIRKIREAGWLVHDVHSPIPSHRITDEFISKKSRVGWFTLCGGILGFFSGFGLAIFTATRWSLIVSGKPIVSLIPFFIVGFEFTILFAVFGNVLGMLTQVGLPAIHDTRLYHPDCSGDAYGLVASAPSARLEDLKRFLAECGAEVIEPGPSGPGESLAVPASAT